MFQHALSLLKLLIIQYTVENWRRELGWIVLQSLALWLNWQDVCLLLSSHVAALFCKTDVTFFFLSSPDVYVEETCIR